MKNVILCILFVVGCEKALDPKDCAGVSGGLAEIDCFGVCGGAAIVDDCGICTGGTTELVFNSSKDCAGICGGNTDDAVCAACLSNTFDCTGVCDGIAIEDCAGVCNGTAVEDCEGVCNGMAMECVGCADPNALNFDNDITIGDSSCIYFPFYEFEDFRTIKEIDSLGNVHGINGENMWGGCIDINYNSQITGNVNSYDLNRIGDASSASFVKSDNKLSISANGYIGGIQITLNHGDDFSIELLDDALIADYNTEGNTTTIVIVVPNSNELFTFEGDFEIVDLIIANSENEVLLEEIYTETTFHSAYPNPLFSKINMEIFVINSNQYLNVFIVNEDYKLMETIIDSNVSSGINMIEWDATNYPSGYYRVISDFGNKQCFMNLYKSN